MSGQEEEGRTVPREEDESDDSGTSSESATSVSELGEIATFDRIYVDDVNSVLRRSTTETMETDSSFPARLVADNERSRYWVSIEPRRRLSWRRISRIEDICRRFQCMNISGSKRKRDDEDQNMISKKSKIDRNNLLPSNLHSFLADEETRRRIMRSSSAEDEDQRRRRRSSSAEDQRRSRSRRSSSTEDEEEQRRRSSNSEDEEMDDQS